MSNNYLDMLNKLKFDANVGEKQKSDSADPNIVQFYTRQFADKNPEYEIRVRLLFDMERGDPNPVVRNWHNFKSAKDGSWVAIDCPKGRCPICNGTFTVWSSGDAFAQDRLKKDRFMRNQTWYLNCYVIDNPVNPSQNGTVKILKMNKPIMEVFKRATSGRDARRFGNNVFRLDEEGNTLVISIKDVRGQDNSRYPNFTDTYFADAEDSKDDVKGITDAMIDQIYSKTFNLGTYFKRSTTEEAEKMFREHVYPAFSDILDGVKKADAPREVIEDESASVHHRPHPVPTKPIAPSQEEDDLPFAPVEESKTEDRPAAPPPPTKDKATTDSQVDDLMKEYGIGDL